MLNGVTAELETTLRAALPDQTFRATDAKYLEEPRGRWAGQGGLVLAPATTADVSTILRHAHAARVPVVPYGGGTGLVGGQVQAEGATPIILTLERMTAIRDVYPSENVMVVEAGAILANVQETAAGHDRLFALSLASEGSARIGGLLSTNAGGINVLRYGNARDQVLGLEVVLPDGTIWNGLSRLRKDNTGYDLRNLMIGAEGTLGVITAAALKLHPRPHDETAAFFVTQSPATALELLSLAGKHFGNSVSAFELISKQGLEFLAATLPDVRRPFSENPDWCVLMDVGVMGDQFANDQIEAFFVAAAERGLVTDGQIAQSQSQRAQFWAVRENIPEGNRRIGSISSHDISVPLSVIPEFIARGNAAIAKVGDFRINCFGHMGDGNLHYNVFPQDGFSRDDYLSERDEIKRVVHDLVHQLGGSVSAEHGIGRLKVDDLERYGDPAKLAAMRAIKTALDPNGIMNPGAVLRVV